MNDIQCYCISLRENESTREKLSKALNNIGLNVNYHIVDRSPLGGCHGCFSSHIEVLKKGLAQQCKYMMVLEDDVYFEGHDIIKKLKDISQFINQLDNSHWCFSFGYLTSSPSTKINHFINRLYHCYCTHAYIVPIQTAKKLSMMQWKNKPIDHQWSEEISAFYVPYPMICFQHDHASSTASPDFITRIGFKNLARLCEVWSCQQYNIITIAVVIVVMIMLMYLNSNAAALRLCLT